MKKISLSIVAPAYNEEDSIKFILGSWFYYLKNSSLIDKYEVVIVNDGSTDSTLQILHEIKLNNKELKIIDLEKNKGAAIAIYEGIYSATNYWVLLMDSDGQYPIDYLGQMITLLNKYEKLDSIFGSRTNKTGSMLQKLGSKLSSLLCNFFYHTDIKDFSSIFKLVKLDVLKNIQLEAKGFNYSTEITLKLIDSGYNIKEIFVETKKRTGGKSNIKIFKDGFSRLVFIFYLLLKKLLIKINILQNYKKI